MIAERGITLLHKQKPQKAVAAPAPAAEPKFSASTRWADMVEDGDDTLPRILSPLQQVFSKLRARATVTSSEPMLSPVRAMPSPVETPKPLPLSPLAASPAAPEPAAEPVPEPSSQHLPLAPRPVEPAAPAALLPVPDSAPVAAKEAEEEPQAEEQREEQEEAVPAAELGWFEHAKHSLGAANRPMALAVGLAAGAGALLVLSRRR